MLNRRQFGWGAGAAMALMASGAAKAASEPLMSLNVLYPRHDGAKFDMDYYRATHIPMVMDIMKASKVTLIEGVPMGEAAAAFVMIAHIQFASPEALQAALANPRMAELRADLTKFTDIKPTVMLGKSA